MTVSMKVMRLDEDKIVVVRRMPMTGDTSDKLRRIRAHYEQQENDKLANERVEMPYPVVFDKMVETIYSQLFPGE